MLWKQILSIKSRVYGPLKGTNGRTTLISSSTSPQSNCAAWERAAARPTPATGEPAASLCRYPSYPSRQVGPGKPPPKLSPCSTHSFLGCAVRKSELPGAMAIKITYPKKRQRKAVKGSGNQLILLNVWQTSQNKRAAKGQQKGSKRLRINSSSQRV